jgi:hypothetical protein
MSENHGVKSVSENTAVGVKVGGGKFLRVTDDRPIRRLIFPPSQPGGAAAGSQPSKLRSEA